MRFSFPVLTGLLTAFLPNSAEAAGELLGFAIPGDWNSKICGVIPCTAGGGGAAGLSNYIEGTFIQVIGVGFLAVSIAMFFYHAVTIIIGSNDENAVKESKTGYAHVIAGGAIVSMASLIVFAFTPGPGGPGQNVVDTADIETGFSNVLKYFRLIIAAALLFNIVFQAIRLIVGQKEEDVDAAKKRLFYGFIGVSIMLLAEKFVETVYPEAGGGQASTGALEIVGIINFLLAAFAFLVIVALVVAGIVLIVSIDESLKDKAKQIVKTALIALAVVVATFSLVSTFILIG